MTLDKKTAKVLEIISKDSNGEYKVIDFVDILDSLPKKFSMDTKELDSICDYLKNLSYIDIKYIDDSEICYAILPKSRIYKENMIEEHKFNKKLTLILILSGIVSGVCSFLGAMMANIVGK